MNHFTVRLEANYVKSNLRSRSGCRNSDGCSRCVKSHVKVSELVAWRCRHCGNVGHIAKYCFKKKTIQFNSRNWSPGPNKSRNRTDKKWCHGSH